MSDRILVSGLAADTVIGLYDWERLVRQSLEVDLELECDLRAAGASDRVVDTVDYKALTQRVRARVESSRYLLIETLACDIAETCLADPRVQRARVTVHKSGALRHARNVAVTVDRGQGEHSGRARHRAFVAVGSNIDPVQHVRAALRALHQEFGALRVSPTFRTRAVGYEGAPDFLNLALELRTDLEPAGLWAFLRDLETAEGRKRSENPNAPRTLDLDLLLFDDVVTDDPSDPHRLPDPDVVATPFVLVPLAEIAADVVHPTLGVTIGSLRARLPMALDGVEPFDDAIVF